MSTDKEDMLLLTKIAYSKTFSHLIHERRRYILLTQEDISPSDAWLQAEKELIEEKKLFPGWKDMGKQ